MAVITAVAYSALLVASAAAHHISSTPPRIAQESSNHLLEKDAPKKMGTDKQKKDETLHESVGVSKLALGVITSTRYISWSILLLEAAVRLLSLYPASRLSSTLLPILISSNTSLIGIQAEPRTWMTPTLTSNPSLSFYLPLLSVFTGFAIRISCFRAMGRHFSFLHTTLEGHRLISTGPYGVVRHPSYTGEVLVRFGMLALLLRNDGILSASGALPFLSSLPSSSIASLDAAPIARVIVVGLLRTAIAVYAGWISFACPYLLLRAKKEDETLRKTFGKQWDEYAKHVPWRFVPYVT